MRWDKVDQSGIHSVHRYCQAAILQASISGFICLFMVGGTKVDSGQGQDSADTA